MIRRLWKFYLPMLASMGALVVSHAEWQGGRMGASIVYMVIAWVGLLVADHFVVLK